MTTSLRAIFMNERKPMNHFHDQIKNQLETHPVVLYMKGNAMFPQCGFSARAVGILKHYIGHPQTELTDQDVLYVNVLENDGIRQAIKDYGKWPTIPQLYVKGELIGGSDIMMELHESGELLSIMSATSHS